MQQYCFRMKLFPGCEAEYKKRHDEIWPELSKLLRDAGVCDYTIWLDREHDLLFAHMHLAENHQLDELPKHPLMRKWWAYMADIMQTNPDHSPVTLELVQMFHQD